MTDCNHTESCKIGMATHGSCPACLQAEVARLKGEVNALLVAKNWQEDWEAFGEMQAELKLLRELVEAYRPFVEHIDTHGEGNAWFGKKLVADARKARSLEKSEKQEEAEPQS